MESHCLGANPVSTTLLVSLLFFFFSRFVFSLSNEVFDRVKGSNPGKVLGLVWSTQLAISRQSLAIISNIHSGM